MFNLFNKEESKKDNNLSLISVASLLIHSAKIDENFTEKEKQIIKKALIEMGAKADKIDEIIEEAEKKEKDSNQILDFTREVKNLPEQNKIKIIKALWSIIYSNKDADIYHSDKYTQYNNKLWIPEGEIYSFIKVVNWVWFKIKFDSPEKIDTSNYGNDNLLNGDTGWMREDVLCSRSDYTTLETFDPTQ